jgi:hypothetical protein
MKRTVALFITAGMIMVALLSLPGLLSRWKAETRNMNAAIVLDLRDISQLASISALDEDTVMERLENSGAGAVMVGEYTGAEMSAGLSPADYGVPEKFEELGSRGFVGDSRAVVAVPKGWKYSSMAGEYLKARFDGTQVIKNDSSTFYILDRGVTFLDDCGILPDFSGLETVSSSTMKLIYRPGPSGNIPAAHVAEALKIVQEHFGPVHCLAPSGEVVAGYPDTEPLAEWGRNKDVPVAQVEFSRQVGAKSLNWRFYPRLLPMHSVTSEEILSRRISERTLLERMIRAVRERSVRLIVMRSSENVATADPLEDFERTLEKLGSSLRSGGIETRWPEPYLPRSNSFLSALGLALVLVLSLYAYISRIWTTGDLSNRKILLLAGLWVLCALAVWKTGTGARFAGAFAASFAAAVATLIALDGWKHPLRGVLFGFLYALAAGLAIAAFFGTTIYMVRLKAFSGVKLTLLLPPLLVLFHDLKRRIHPESISDILSRPPIWGELVLLGVAGLAAIIVLFRSGNVQFVPDWEIALRDSLERLLVARPRNKEIFAGYPFLFLWYLFRRKDLWRRYREILRIGATLAFATMINSFCHFHTRLYFTILREFNGLWAGILTGTITVAVFAFLVLPLWKRFRGALME